MTPPNNPSSSWTRQVNQPRPKHAPEEGPDSSEPKQAHPRWAITSWWWVVIAAEVTVLAVLGYMASGDRYPLAKTSRWPAPDSYTPVTPSEIVGTVILGGVLIGVFTLFVRWWWKLVLVAALAVTLAVVVFLFDWGTEERLSMNSLPVPSPAWRQAHDTCREQYPTAAEEAFRRGRVPDECRDIWLNAATTTTTTTTTLPPIQTKRARLLRDLDAEDRAALKALSDTYEILARALDNNEQTAILAYVAAQNSGNQELEDTAREIMADTLDDLDRIAIQLVFDAYGRLREQLDSKQFIDPWDGINGYLSIAKPKLSAFDRVLDAMDFDLNMTEVDTLLEALN